MSYKFLGASLIVCSCGGFGFSVAWHHRRETKLLEEIISILDLMISELSYRLTPLPELMQQASSHALPILRKVFITAAEQLERQVLPDVSSCMDYALSESQLTFSKVSQILSSLGLSLGRFDLPGQIKGLSGVRNQCQHILQESRQDLTERLRCYRTLGICAGIAVAVLLI